MSDVLDNVKFWNIVLAEAGRTIVCSGEQEDQIRRLVDESCMAGFLKVQSSPVVNSGEIYVVDENAVQAMINESLARPVYCGPRPPSRRPRRNR
jgi:hypothetical protein